MYHLTINVVIGYNKLDSLKIVRNYSYCPESGSRTTYWTLGNSINFYLIDFDKSS